MKSKKFIGILASSSFVLPVVALSAGCNNTSETTTNIKDQFKKITKVDVNTADKDVYAKDFSDTSKIIVTFKDGKTPDGITIKKDIIGVDTTDSTKLKVKITLSDAKNNSYSQEYVISGFKKENPAVINLDDELVKVSVDVEGKDKMLTADVQDNNLKLSYSSALTSPVTASAKIKSKDKTSIVVTITVANGSETKDKDVTVDGFKAPAPAIDFAPEFAKITKVDVEGKDQKLVNELEATDIKVTYSQPLSAGFKDEVTFVKKTDTSITVTVKLINGTQSDKKEFEVTGFKAPTTVPEADKYKNDFALGAKTKEELIQLIADQSNADQTKRVQFAYSYKSKSIAYCVGEFVWTKAINNVIAISGALMDEINNKKAQLINPTEPLHNNKLSALISLKYDEATNKVTFDFRLGIYPNDVTTYPETYHAEFTLA